MPLVLIKRETDMGQTTVKTLKSQSVDKNEAHRRSGLHEDDNMRPLQNFFLLLPISYLILTGLELEH